MPTSFPITVVAGQTHKGKATIRGFGEAANAPDALRLKISFRLK